jgi:hypothetical protein
MGDRIFRGGPAVVWKPDVVERGGGWRHRAPSDRDRKAGDSSFVAYERRTRNSLADDAPCGRCPSNRETLHQ